MIEMRKQEREVSLLSKKSEEIENEPGVVAGEEEAVRYIHLKKRTTMWRGVWIGKRRKKSHFDEDKKENLIETKRKKEEEKNEIEKMSRDVSYEEKSSYPHRRGLLQEKTKKKRNVEVG